VLVHGGVDGTPKRRDVRCCARAVRPDRAEHDRAKARVMGELHLRVGVRCVLGRVLDRADEQLRLFRTAAAGERQR